MRLTIDALGQTHLDRDLLRFEANLAAPAGALLNIGTMLREMVERQFDSEGGASGGWAPLADSTVAAKQRQGLDPRILQATGRLKESLTRKFDSEHTERLSGSSLAFGTKVPYAIYHQTGTASMPARPPLALTDADKVTIVKTLQRALLTGTPA